MRWKAKNPNRSSLPSNPFIDNFHYYSLERFLRINCQWWLILKPSFCKRVIDERFFSLVYSATDSIPFSKRKLIALTVRADARFLLRRSGRVAAVPRSLSCHWKIRCSTCLVLQRQQKPSRRRLPPSESIPHQTAGFQSSTFRCHLSLLFPARPSIYSFNKFLLLVQP
jgi:hypothetical protein